MTQKEIQNAIYHFKFRTQPTSGNQGTVCTVGDIQRLIDETAKLFELLATEISHRQ